MKLKLKSFFWQHILAVVGAMVITTAFVAGCLTPAKSGTITATAQGASGGLKQNLGTAHDEAVDIAEADPTNPTVAAHVKSLLNAIASAQDQTKKMDLAIELTVTQASQIKGLTIENSTLRGEFFSPRQRAWAIWLVLLGVALIVLDFLQGFANPVGMAATVLFHAGSLCLKLVFTYVGQFNDWFAVKVKGWFGSAAAYVSGKLATWFPKLFSAKTPAPSTAPVAPIAAKP